jgi:hypothetical protein
MNAMVDFAKHPRLDVFKFELVSGARFSTTYEFPLLERTYFIPEKAIPFEKASKATDHRQWVHFYTHDRNFECVWREPKRYLAMLKRFSGIVTPDFSLYREMPLAMQIWNTYRNRALAYWLQNNRVRIVPNVRWGDERTYKFAFEGLMPGGSVAISTNGCIQSKLERWYFQKGLAAMVDALKPDTIVNYSQTPDDIFARYVDQRIRIVQIENHMQTVRKQSSARAVV